MCSFNCLENPLAFCTLLNTEACGGTAVTMASASGNGSSRPGLPELVSRAERDADTVDVGRLAAQGLLLSPQEMYLTGTYPPLKAMRDVTEMAVLADASRDLNLYLHIPFCRQRCTFCHFAKEIRAGQQRVAAYLGALNNEIALARQKLPGPRAVNSVYFGGGTPSLLPPDELAQLLATLSAHFPFDNNAEVTFELHPQIIRDRGLLREMFAVLTSGGVNRIAFGAQSLDDWILRTLNRGHSAADVLALVDFFQDEVGFENFSVDLMYGLPHESLESWFASLSGMVERGVAKLNIFPLFFKVTDPVSWLYERRPGIFPSQRQRLITHLITERYLSDQGFDQGPVLYYSRAEQHSRQQESKFDDIEATNLLGLGVSSFGYLGGTQYYNRCGIDDYVASVHRGCLPVWRGVTLGEEERARRTIMFGLRSAGVRRAHFAHRFGLMPERMFPELRRFHELGLLNLRDDTWVPAGLGGYCIDGMASKLASERVRRQVEAANKTLPDPRRNLLEQLDFSPLGRRGSSVPRPRTDTGAP